MAALSSDVYASTKEQAADEKFSPYSDYLKKRASAALKYEGSPTAVLPTTSIADQLKADKTYRAGEYSRREKAGEQEANLAKSEDVRTGSVADRVRNALYDRQKAVQNVATQQSQMERTAEQRAREAQQDFGQKLAQQEYSSFSNATKRYDEIQDAYSKGIAEFQLLDAARSNSLQMADLDRYYTIVTNDIKNQITGMQAMAEADMQIALRKIENQAKGAASIIDGLFSIGGRAITSLFED